MICLVPAAVRPEVATPLQPDFAWVGDALRNLSGGWLAVCMTVAVAAFGLGAFRWIFSKVTSSRWDDVHGTQVLAAVAIGALALGALPGLVQFGMDASGSTPTAQVQEYDGPTQKPDDTGGNILSDLGDWAGDLADKAGQAAQDAKNTVKKWFDSAKDSVTSQWKGFTDWLGGGWNSIKENTTNAWDSLKQGASDTRDSIKQGASDAMSFLNPFD